MKKGIFIAFEGGEGSGKTTQIQMLARFLESEGHSILVTKEPGGDESICREIRALLLDATHTNVLDHRAELMLFLADRAQHAAQVLRPALDQGKIILCDRYAASTFAYQYYARQVADFDFIKKLNDFVSSKLIPDLTFFIDIDPLMGIRRKSKQGLSRIDGENIEFHKKVRNGFYNFFNATKWPASVIDGSLPIEFINKEISVKTKKLINELRG